MKDDYARFGALIDRIYQGALEPELWPVVIKEIADWMGAPKISLFTPTLSREEGGFTFDHQIPSDLIESWWSKYQQEDEYVVRIMRKGLGFQGNVVLDSDVIAENELFASPYYHEFLALGDMPRLLTGVIFDAVQDDAPFTACAMYRGRKHKPFTEADRTRYKLLMPHLSRALGTQFRLWDAEQRVAASQATLDGLGTAVMLVGAGAEIVFANRAALTLLAEGDGLRLRGLTGGSRWRLIAEHGATQKKIDAALRRAADPDSLTAAHFSRAIPVPRPSGLAPYALQLSALPQRNDFGAGGGGDLPRAILFVTDTAKPPALDAETLRHLFGLTASEARLAAVLGEGMGLQEAADALEVSHNTAKSQLQQVYQKTGVDTRARLMKLLMALTRG